MKTLFIKTAFRLVVTLLFFAVSLTCSAQTQITLELQSPVAIDSVNVMDVSFKASQTLPYKETLAFNLNKTILDWYNIRYFVNNKMYRQQIWLDSGKVIVKAHLADTTHLVIDTVINSPVYYSVKDYYKINAGKDTLARNKYMLAQVEKYLETPRSIVIAGDYLRFNSGSKVNLFALQDVLLKQKTDFSWFILYNSSITTLHTLLSAQKLNIADYNFTDINGESTVLKLEGYDYYLLDFWFLGCPPCRRDHMWISDNKNSITSHKIKVISITTDAVSYTTEWKNYLATHKYDWDNYMQAGKVKLTERLNINIFPTYLLLSSKGEIVGTSNSVINALERFKIN